jgi:hypothetical protein
LKPKTEAQYKKWLEEVKSSLPETKRGHFEALADDEGGFKIFEGYLGGKEFDRVRNEVEKEMKAVQADRALLTQAVESFVNDVKYVDQWYKTEQPKNQQLAEQYSALASQYQIARQKLIELGLEDATNSNTSTISPTSGAVPDGLAAEIKAIKERLAKQDQAVPRVIADMGAVLREAAKEGFDVDTDAVMAHSSRRGVDLRTAYRELTQEQREAKAETMLEKKLEEAREEGRRSALSKFPSPERLRPSGPSVFDHLNASNAPVERNSRVNEAVKEFIDTGGTL